jgi:hypothetical protein
MVQWVKSGATFDEEALRAHGSTEKLIEIAQFEDKHIFLHNGHHRCVAIWLGGRFQIEDSEYYIKQWKYEDYNRIGFENEYYTPFNIVNEVRIQNLAPYKMFIKSLIFEFGEEMAYDVIWQAKPLYATERKLKQVYELANLYLSHLGKGE